eukprot:jgi/Tetstr1/457578/TSEL_044146.t1
MATPPPPEPPRPQAPLPGATGMDDDDLWADEENEDQVGSGGRGGGGCPELTADDFGGAAGRRRRRHLARRASECVPCGAHRRGRRGCDRQGRAADRPPRPRHQGGLLAWAAEQGGGLFRDDRVV